MDLSFQEKKRFVIPRHGSQATAVLVIWENSCVFLSHPVYSDMLTGVARVMMPIFRYADWESWGNDGYIQIAKLAAGNGGYIQIG